MEASIKDPEQMNPMMPPEGQRELEDLAFELVSKASSLAGRMSPIVTNSVGELVRSMNCYYSNLIEGHSTRLRDINRALRQDYATEPERRKLQVEAVAHIEVQQAIDEGRDEPAEPTSRAYTMWLHGEFCKRLPEDSLWLEDKATNRIIRIAPGEFRDGEVAVGRHLPPPFELLPDFFAKFEKCLSVRWAVARAAGDCDCGGASPVCVDPSFLRREWARGQVDVACDFEAAGDWECVVECVARVGAECGPVQSAVDGGGPAGEARGDDAFDGRVGEFLPVLFGCLFGSD